ncbi:hypothetical protein [[Mycoplasma] testudinis]|uniref:hypothetical protein n=1 Tax=[Mycoplasma] testudinis TaxID=33924 RepID=UPI000487C99A|nr:hypothetical protein [[Mycoplasma] testudinis]
MKKHIRWLIPFLTTAFSIPVIFSYTKNDLPNSHNEMQIVNHNSTTQQKQEDLFLKKIQSNQVTKQKDKIFENFLVHDANSIQSEKVEFQNNSYIYKPDDFTNLQTQTSNALNSVNNKLVNDFEKKVNDNLAQINNYVKITRIKPIAQATGTSVYDSMKPRESFANDLAYERHSYYMVTGSSGYLPTGKSIMIGPSNWLNQNTYEAQIKFKSLDGNQWTNYQDINQDFSFDLSGKSYKEGKIKFKFNGTEFDFKIPQINDLLDLPERSYGGSNEFAFIISLTNDGRAPYVENSSTSWRSFYRFGLEVKGEVVPNVSLDTTNYQLQNKDLKATESNSVYYLPFVSSSSQTIVGENTYFSKRRAVFEQIKNLQENESYKNATTAKSKNVENITSNALKLQKIPVNPNYEIYQYNYVVPERLSTNVQNYLTTEVLSNSFRQYEGIENLIAEKIRILKNSGVTKKAKPVTNVYTQSDEDQINLQFGLDQNFSSVLNAIDNINLLIKKIQSFQESQDKSKALEKLRNFEINMTDLNQAVQLLDNQEELIKIIVKSVCNESNCIFDLIQNNLNLNGAFKTFEKLNYYHDLPELINEFLNKTTIDAQVDYGDNKPTTLNVFSKNSFNKLEVRQANAINPLSNIASNIIQIKLSNMIINYQDEKFPKRKLINLRNLLNNYLPNNTFVVNQNLLVYEINYRSDFKDLKILNEQDDAFKILKSNDPIGLIASGYLNEKNASIARQNVAVTVQNYINSDSTIPQINAADIEIINKQKLAASEYQENLKQLINSKNINVDINDQLGYFYAVVGIKNSNDLRKIGSILNPEVSTQKMWLIMQSKTQPNLRYYLMRLKAAKIKIKWDQIHFAPDSKNKRINLQIDNFQLNKNKYFDFRYDANNLINQKQEWKLPDTNDYQLQWTQTQEEKMQLWFNLEMSLNDFGIGINNAQSSIDMSEHVFNIQLMKLQDQDQNMKYGFIKSEINYIKINPSSVNNIYWLTYQIDEQKLEKIPLEIQLKEPADSSKTPELIVKPLQNLTKSTNDIYIKPFQKKIEQDLIKLSQEKFSKTPWKLTDLKIDFQDSKNTKMKIDHVSQKPSQQRSSLSKALIIALGVIGSISGLGLIIGAGLIIYKKHYNRWPWNRPN